MALPHPDDTPRTATFSEVARFDDLDQRLSAATVLFGSVFGLSDGVEWVPDDIPPTEQERLAWLWLVDPGRTDDILPIATPPLHSLLTAYQSGRMPQWWQQIAQPDQG